MVKLTKAMSVVSVSMVNKDPAFLAHLAVKNRPVATICVQVSAAQANKSVAEENGEPAKENNSRWQTLATIKTTIAMAESMKTVLAVLDRPALAIRGPQAQKEKDFVRAACSSVANNAPGKPVVEKSPPPKKTAQTEKTMIVTARSTTAPRHPRSSLPA